MDDTFKLKRCIECGETLFVDVEVPEERTFDGTVYTEMLPVQECTRCKENFALGLDLREWEDKLVAQLEKLDSPGPEAKKFVEKIKRAREQSIRFQRLHAVID